MLKIASPHGTRREVLATALSMLASPLLAATATTKFVLTSAAWTDLGAGPLLLSFKGDGVYAVSDTVPSLTGGFTRARGGSIPIDTASHVWAMAASANGAAVYAAPIMPGGGPLVTSVWSASDAAANGMTLSNGGLTVTPSGFGSWTAIRSSIGKTSGQLYIEFKVAGTIDSGINTQIGLASSGFVINSYLGSSNYSEGTRPTVGNYVSAGFTDVIDNPTVGVPVTGDVWALAVDFVAGKIWLAQNNVWPSSGNPATGASPIVTFVPATVGALFAAMTFQSNPGVWTLQPTAASQKYAPPSGFSPWG